MNAWLISWVAPGSASAVEDEIAAVLNPVYSKDEVRGILALMYQLRTGSLVDLAAWATDDNPTKGVMSDEGSFMEHGGSGPLLDARIVTNLRVKTDESSGLETISWTEPLPHGKDRTVTRRIKGPLSGKGIWDRSKGGFKPGWGPGEVPAPRD